MFFSHSLKEEKLGIQKSKLTLFLVFVTSIQNLLLVPFRKYCRRAGIYKSIVLHYYSMKILYMDIQNTFQVTFPLVETNSIYHKLYYLRLFNQKKQPQNTEKYIQHKGASLTSRGGFISTKQGFYLIDFRYFGFYVKNNVTTYKTFYISPILNLIL